MAVACLAALLVVLAFVSFTVGTYSMTAEQLLSTIRAFVAGSIADAETSRSVAVLFSIRIPRVLLACAVGAALAVSGAAYQGIFRNPMVSPDILGVSNAASVGVALGLLWGFPTVVVHAMSFAFGIGAVALVLLVSHVATRRSADATLVMILSGVVIGSLGQAVLSLVKYIADPDNTLPAITY
ncbi:iron complex transport system permease protein [Olsenella sp. KH3B4]|nr:iron complex transport system permease protein [Olsenella sp. KH3B4]